MLGTHHSAEPSSSAVPFRAPAFAWLARFFRRWLALLGQQPAMLNNPDIEAYALLAKLRRQRAQARNCGQVRGIVISMPTCVDDAQVNLRITM